MDQAADSIRGVAEETGRLRVLREMRVLDSAPDTRFDRIVRAAALAFRAPRAAVILVDEARLWIKAAVGAERGDHPRAGGLAEQMIRRREPYFSGDIAADPEFAQVVRDNPRLDARFYACAPIVAAGGQVLGILAVGDVEPHVAPTREERRVLADLAALASEELERDGEAARLRAESAEHRAASHLDRQRIELAMEAARLGEFEWDVAGGQVLVSPRLSALVGLPSGPTPTEDAAFVLRNLPPGDRQAVRRAFTQALAGEGPFEAVYRWRRPDDGRLLWHRCQAVLVGESQRLIGVVEDVTDRKAEEERREALVFELDHRVKNLLASVQALAFQSARKTTSLDSFLKTFAGRLSAMASAHDLLTATRWGGARLGDIAAAELGGIAPSQTRWEGPELMLTPRAANALSLALHELATNALKYGALSADLGRVEVIWRIAADGGFDLEWLENGGPPVRPPTRRGFGATLLEDVAGRELGGAVRIDYRPSGLLARLHASAGALAPVGETAATPEAPIVKAAESPAMVEGGARTDVRGLRVLIVEDSLLLALELEQGLEEAGAVIAGSAAEVEEAMAMLDRPFDAAVLDANLNGQSVAPVAEVLRERGTPFVFATGYADKAAPGGFDAPIVRKPYNVGQIARALAEVTRARAREKT